MEKRPWESKTYGLNLLGFIILWILYHFYPHYHEVMCGNSEIILSIVFLINVILRGFTKHAIKFLVLGCLLHLVACSGVQQTLSPDVFYKRDIQLQINGGTYTGVTVVPHAVSYSVTLIPPGNIDLMLIRSCHREYSIEKVDSGWSLFGSKKQKFTYQYTPIAGIEDTRVCPLRIDIYESSAGRQSWALLDFEDPKYTLQSDVTCNGSVIHVNGVGACQAKEQTVQAIKFSQPVRFAPSPLGCNDPKKVADHYEISASVGECLYTFDSQDGKLGRMILIGWQGVLVREAQ